ncbi:uncharacterized protein SAPINGB_P004992 [Magnusiomyces paraingens]|uniref:F-box domain-containing protein n=1 Tax=Magnusiomyces paraingens TaxID=2606893 RepID=A0A5E8C3I9_9ASCO|nr:uncharacterized protein SAPINGB_P004992 [Saprochaete ingens]VVT56348.1 unnamed protein product [Saprochaete ingens]
MNEAQLKETFEKGMAKAHEHFVRSELPLTIQILERLENRLRGSSAPTGSAHARSLGSKSRSATASTTTTDPLAPLLFQVLDRRCLCARRMKDFDRAQKDAQRMVTLCPREPKGYLVLGRVAEMRGKPMLAHRTYTEGLKRCAGCRDSSEKTAETAYKAMETALAAIPINDLQQQSSNVKRQQQQQQQHPQKLKSRSASPAIGPGVDPLSKLPYFEVFQPILNSLDFKSLLACMSVSRRWREMIMSDDRMISERLDLTINTLSNGWRSADLRWVLKWGAGGARGKKRVIQNVIVDTVRPGHEAGVVEALFSTYSHNIKKLKLNLKQTTLFDFFLSLYGPKPINFCTNLESLILDAPFSTLLLSIALPMFTALKRLEINFNPNITPNYFFLDLSKKDPPSDTRPGPQNLEVLQLFNIAPDLKWYIPKYIRSKLTKLKTLTLSYSKCIQMTDQLEEQFTEMLENLPDLESLTLNAEYLSSSPNMVKSPRLKNLSFYHPQWSSAPRNMHGPEAQLPTKDLRIQYGNITISSGPEFLACLRHLGCGHNLTLLLLENVRLPYLYDEEGYDRYVRHAFPNLQTLSFGGVSEVGDETASAIVAREPFPQNVIVSQTSTSYFGVRALITAGVQRIGIQRCYFTMKQLLEIKNSIELIEFDRFNRPLNDQRVA